MVEVVEISDYGLWTMDYGLWTMDYKKIKYMSNTKILYVEDEAALAYIVKDALIARGYEVELVEDGGEVMNACKAMQPDICLLDVMLPNVDGFSLGTQLRQEYPQLPIIFLTAKNQTNDVLKGFRSGGNDYIRKPFSLEELIVRIENLLTLQGTNQKEREVNQHMIGNYHFDPQKMELVLQGRIKKLTYRETELLMAFVKNKNEVIQKNELLIQIWGDDTISNARSMDVYITKLRNHLADDSSIQILTLRGVGYRFVVG